MLQSKKLYGHNHLPEYDKDDGSAENVGDIAISAKEATPDWVFRQLCNRILPRRQQASAQELAQKIVVDISGAKKNMAAGALLFADYAGATISYVDFGEYDAKKRRPYGFTCRIAEQPNPYQILSLRDWQRIRELYQHCFFRAAAEELKNIAEKMQYGLIVGKERVRYFLASECGAVEHMIHAMHLLEQWDNGNHVEAYRLWTNSHDGRDGLQYRLPQPTSFVLPGAVQILGTSKWPSTITRNAQQLLTSHEALKYGNAQDSLFSRIDWLIVYAQDEIAKIGRLIQPNEDYRSALLRAAALDEFLLKARVALLWNYDQLNCNSTLGSECFKAIVSSTNSDKMREFLQGNLRTLIVKSYQPRREFSLTHRTALNAETLLRNYWQNTTLSPKQMVELRGESIHTFLPIPMEIATAAYEIAQASVYDFIKYWAKRFAPTANHSPAWQPDWAALCVACGVTFLPPQVKQNYQEVSP